MKRSKICLLLNHRTLAFALGTLLGVLVFTQPLLAETTDFGGRPDRFKGAGDKVPPQCQVDLPKASTEPFFVKWNCSDNFAKAEDIRSELWIYKIGSPTGQLFGNFLGFPASVFIDKGVLNVEEFTDGLPVTFRLLAKDRAGNAAVSGALTVRAQDNSLSGCAIQITTEATESEGSTTGVPSLIVRATDAAITVDQVSETALNITSASVFASTCQIPTICANDKIITFSSSLTLGENSEATGSLNVNPGGISTQVSGTASVSGVTLETLQVDGTTQIDGADASVTLSCEK